MFILLRLFGLLFLFSLPVAGQGTLRLPAEQGGMDERLRLLVVRHQPGGAFTTLALGDQTYELVDGVAGSTEPGAIHEVVQTSTGELYDLHFTDLPLFKITTEAEIDKDDKVPAIISYGDGEQSFTKTAGVEYRGAFSLTFPKKSLDLEFDDDVQFLDLREDDDWVLDALYNEPLRINSYVGHKLWLDQYELPYAREERRAKPGADVAFVETFLNGRYYGLMMLSEQVDRKQLRLKREEDGRVRGELYKGDTQAPATKFEREAEPPVDGEELWSGYEWKHPDLDRGPDWANLYDLHQFVTGASDQDFSDGIGDRFDLDNAIDYLLYINLLAAHDNTSRNIYTARYDADEPYFHLPWDLDGSFGNAPRGIRSPAVDAWYGNGLYRRLTRLSPDNFNERLCQRYQELRRGVFSPEAIYGRFTVAYENLQRSGVYGREELRWASSLWYDQEQLDYTQQWLTDRVAFLDDFVCELSFAPARTEARLPFITYPNPSPDGRITVEQDAGFMAEYYEITDMVGRRVAVGNVALRTPLDLSRLPRGSYFLRVGQHSTLIFLH